ncbi:hypothetical protein CPB84DRAFT_1746087 [Gymnopilus junonius]|uniref:Uncharacterized protein n=1 Tax=Gymnopilus junonius TaxID=109634 RepID=A0A9P5NRC9_GYMJU|nr:hypothetical protein CPB84DRAFT_1746087 [Gymnopilus junonius]
MITSTGTSPTSKPVNVSTGLSPASAMCGSLVITGSAGEPNLKGPMSVNTNSISLLISQMVKDGVWLAAIDHFDNRTIGQPVLNESLASKADILGAIAFLSATFSKLLVACTFRLSQDQTEILVAGNGEVAIGSASGDKTSMISDFKVKLYATNFDRFGQDFAEYLSWLCEWHDAYRRKRSFGVFEGGNVEKDLISYLSSKANALLDVEGTINMELLSQSAMTGIVYYKTSSVDLWFAKPIQASLVVQLDGVFRIITYNEQPFRTCI